MILIGSRIKNLRNKYKLTQTELANKLGVTRSTIAAYENDTRMPSYDVLVKLSSVFKVSVDFLLLNCTDNNSPGMLDVRDLDARQLRLLTTLIAYFRETKNIDDLELLSKFSSEIPTSVPLDLNMKLEKDKE